MRALVAFLLLLPATGWARTWEIQENGLGDAPTVQAGIDSAAVGDTVQVHPGTYNEAINFLGKDIVVKSTSGREATVLDGAGGQPNEFGVSVVTFRNGESRAAIVQGFTITGGEHGVLIIDAAPTVRENLITGNQGARDGGGIWCGAFDVSRTWFPLIEKNQITLNEAGNIGGGIGTWNSMAPEILDNVIIGNEARDGDGGGIYFRGLSGDDGALIRGNLVESNFAGDHGGGIYIGHVGDGTFALEVSDNLIQGNTANGRAMTGNSGGGVWMWEANTWFHHNTVVNNTGNGPTSTYGGGIVIERPSTPVIEQNIIAFSPNGGGIFCQGGTTPTFRNNLIWENLPSHGAGDCPIWWLTDTSNIVADPLFCDMASGDYSLSAKSPAITHPAGPLGAIPDPGCDIVPTIPATWGQIKARYR